MIFHINVFFLFLWLNLVNMVHLRHKLGGLLNWLGAKGVLGEVKVLVGRWIWLFFGVLQLVRIWHIFIVYCFLWRLGISVLDRNKLAFDWDKGLFLQLKKETERQELVVSSEAGKLSICWEYDGL